MPVTHFHLARWTFHPISHGTAAEVAGSAFATARGQEGAARGGVVLFCSTSTAESTGTFIINSRSFLGDFWRCFQAVLLTAVSASQPCQIQVLNLFECLHSSWRGRNLPQTEGRNKNWLYSLFVSPLQFIYQLYFQDKTNKPFYRVRSFPVVQESNEPAKSAPSW